MVLVAIPLAVLGSAFFWALGGDFGSSIRILCGITIAICCLFVVGFSLVSLVLATLLVLGLWGATSIGYGIPDDPFQPNGDDGSPLGKFWYETAKEFGYTTHADRAHVANVLTRGTVGLVYGLAVSPFCLIKGHWWWIIILPLIACANTVFWNAFCDDMPPFEIGPLKLNAKELITGAGVGLCGLLSLV
ncbi:MAG: hypothetical protein CMI54_03545 [Parcubacteria group bacterium]|jgi:hypothetical protein|nr:hypothetical protein [Parcubacteria group bacterium]|tara:strand:- start:992 stop:1558 length:567 start_codon:yes stop_codon:yes gene_type:complete